MKTLREYIKEADEKHIAIGHFNISNTEALHAIARAASSLKLPVIIGVAEGEEDFLGMYEAVALVKVLRENYDHQPIFLNADHHYSFERVKACIDAGFDSVIIDNAKLPMDENIAITKQCVEYARKVTAETGRDILVEAELGFIGQASKVYDTIPEGIDEANMTTPEMAKTFVEATGIDLFAPYIGNIHGMVKSGKPRLHPDRVTAIRQAINIPLVLHGGSGSLNQDFIDSIKNGINIVHINTEIRVAYRDAIQKFMNDNPNEVAPYRFLKPGVDAVQAVVTARLKLFSGME